MINSFKSLKALLIDGGPGSLQSRVSTVKIRVLSAMIPSCKRHDSINHTFLWNGKQAKLKLATLQRTNAFPILSYTIKHSTFCSVYF